jgi:hypothetical protein
MAKVISLCERREQKLLNKKQPPDWANNFLRKKDVEKVIEMKPDNLTWNKFLWRAVMLYLWALRETAKGNDIMSVGKDRHGCVKAIVR